MKYKIIAFLLLLAIIASGILSAVPIDQACGQEESGCYIVQASEYEKTFGIKNSTIGLVAFSILFVLTIFQIKRPTKLNKKILILGLGIGSIFALYFLYLQVFILNATCPYCLTTDLGTILSFFILLFWKEK
jgi:uncharacterized membrane protein